MKVASTISPLRTFRFSFRFVTLPSASVWRMVRVSLSDSVTDCSFEKKSFAPMVATLVLESCDQSPMECGLFFANCLTARGARRSEFPSRSTGFTRSEEHTSELQSRGHLVCRLLLEKKK